MSTQILFPHPDIMKRKENFGGVVQTTKGVIVLNEEQYNLLINFSEQEVLEEEISEDLAFLLSINAICKIDKKTAETVNQTKPLDAP